MPIISNVQLLRGSTNKNDAYTGKSGELTVNTDSNTIRVHDGITAGGIGTQYVARVPEGQMPAIADKDWPVGAFVVEGSGEIMFHTSSDVSKPYMSNGMPEITIPHQVATMDGEPVYMCCYVGMTGSNVNQVHPFAQFDGDDIIILTITGTIRNLRTGKQVSILSGDVDVNKFSNGLAEKHSESEWNDAVICAFVTYINA